MSASTTDVAEKKAREGGIPVWAAGGIIALVLALGGWGLWSFWQSMSMRGSGAVVELDVKPSEWGGGGGRGGGMGWQMRVGGGGAGRNNAQAGANAPDYVRVGRGNNRWEAKGGRTRLAIVKTDAGALRFDAESLEADFIKPEDRQVLSLRVRVISEAALARQLEVTDAQRTQLAGIPRGASYPINDATRQKLTAAFEAWLAAPDAEKAAKAQPLIDAVKELETAEMENTRKAIAARAAQVRTVLTAEQIAKFQALGRPAPAGTTTAPTGR